MSAALFLLSLSSFGLITGAEITFPEDGAAYNSPDLNVRAVLDFENLMADQVLYSLNGGPPVVIPRLDTDWYTYMGNDLHTGFSESPAPHDATILWTAPVTGTVHEFPNPVVVDGVVYYPSDLGTDSLYALDALTGEIIWKYLVGLSDDAVTVKDGLLFIASDSLWCLNALTGARVWATSQADGTGSTPVVAAGMVFAGSFFYSPYINRVSAFDALTGAECWSTGNYPVGYQASCMTYWNGMLIVPTAGVGDGALYALDASSGEMIWINNDAVEGYWDSSPVVVDGIIYIGGQDGYLHAIDAMSGESVWATVISSSGSDVTATPAYHAGYLYVGATSGPFVRVDAGSGEIQWTVDLPIHGSPCVADGLVFFGENMTGENARVIALDCATGEVVWTHTVEANRFQSTPAVTDGVLYIAAIDGLLYAFGTGLKYSYDGLLTAEIGWNELIVEASCPGGTVFADTVSFLVDPYGIEDDTPGQPLSPVLQVLQNPASSIAHLILVSPSQAPAEIELFDLGGRAVASALMPAGTSQQVDLDVSGVPAGVYLARWEQDGISGATRLVVLR
jgi:outer membrane protein assembly factor BamB